VYESPQDQHTPINAEMSVPQECFLASIAAPSTVHEQEQVHAAAPQASQYPFPVLEG
jgi:hypothetical protein